MEEEEENRIMTDDHMMKIRMKDDRRKWDGERVRVQGKPSMRI